jgi:SEC-C motif-containing protein
LIFDILAETTIKNVALNSGTLHWLARMPFNLCMDTGSVVYYAYGQKIETRRWIMDLCPCGSGIAYPECCEPLISGHAGASTAEALMRSRYSAYVKTKIDYIYETTHASQRAQFNREESIAWSRKAEWHSLEILGIQGGGDQDTEGTVEFVARYREKERMVKHHEIAEFVRENGVWFFKDGQTPKQEQAVRQGPKVGRNDPCPCGGGKKYKKCCGR